MMEIDRKRTAGHLLLAGAALSLLAAPGLRAQESARVEPAQAIDGALLRAHVERLASEEFAGRRIGPGMEKAREYLCTALRAAGVEPAGESGFYQDVMAPGRDARIGRNILARIEGSDPELAKQFVVLAAHYDHLGVRGGKIHPGADDNASGVATVLEVARVLGVREARPRRSVLLALFDAEERGLRGARHFVDHPTVPLESIAWCLNLDMLGRAAMGMFDEFLFAQGWEHSPELKPLLRSTCAASDPAIVPALISVAATGVRSDHGPFLWRRIPTLFLSNGEHEDYHGPGDTSERVRFDLLLGRARTVCRLVAAVAARDERPRFVDAAPDMDEVRSLQQILVRITPRAAELGLGTEEKLGLVMLRGRLKRILQRGEYRPRDQEDLKKIVQSLMRALR